MSTEFTKISSCRMCKSTKLRKAISLGSTPLANSFITKNNLSLPEPFYPLKVNFCSSCGHLQLGHTVSPELLFKNYVYVSSTSPVFVAHFEEYARTVYKKLKLSKNSFVVDIGSNDGILLKPFKKLGVKVLGIDPAAEIAETATRQGLETIPQFFDQQLAREIVAKHGETDAVFANNVFAHVDDIDELTDAVRTLLKPSGVFIIEVPYLVDLLEKNLFDTIYHEHLSYYAIKPLVKFFNRHDMEVFDVKKTSSHGGSIRVFVKKNGAEFRIERDLKDIIEKEKRSGLFSFGTYVKFGNKIRKNKTALTKILHALKTEGKTIAGYGAPAKGNTLLNYFGIGRDLLDYIVDDSPIKQGLYTPGTHIPVVSSKQLKINPPDYILVLAWNFAESIMERLSDFRKSGGGFIIPVPNPKIIEDKTNVCKDIVESDLGNIIEEIGNDVRKLEGKTLVISGGSGFLGSYINQTILQLNKTVLKKKCHVISVDNYITGSKTNNFLSVIDDRCFEFLSHDIRLPLLIPDHVDYIIHAAGLASPFYYQKYPLETIEATITGAKNLLDLARLKKVRSFLFFSSSEIYGDPDQKHLPTPETYVGRVSSIGPRSCYDESKRLGETISLVYYRQFGVPIKIVRPFNVYGPGMKSDDYRVIPTFLSHGLNGKDLPVHDKGRQTRTFCYVSDAIVGFFKILLSGKDGEVYNVGNPKPEITMYELAKTINRLMGNRAKIKRINYPSSYPKDDPQRRCPDLTKIKLALNYEPKIGLEDGLERTVAWYRGRYNL